MKLLLDSELPLLTKTVESLIAESKLHKDPTPGLHDTSPLGTGKNWVTDAGGLPPYMREIAHALIRSGHPESEAIHLAVGTVERWKQGQGNVNASTRAKALAAWTQWLAIRAKAHAEHLAKQGAAVVRGDNSKKSDPVWDDANSDAANRPETKGNTMTGPAAVLEHKVASVQGSTVTDETEGIVTTLVSVTGIVDNVNDDIRPGVYGKSLAKRTPKGIWSHDWNIPVAKTLEAKELMPGDPELPKTLRDGSAWPADAGALKIVTQFNLKTTAGKDAFESVRFYGPEQEWSIGYQVPTGGSTQDTKTGKRTINAIELYEYSPVLFGAMPQAVTQNVKSAQEAIRYVNEHDGEMKAEWFTDELPFDIKDLVVAGSEVKDVVGANGDADEAMPDIKDDDDLNAAIAMMPHHKFPDKLKAHIKKHAKDMGKEGLLPEPWKDEKTLEGKDMDLMPADPPGNGDDTDDIGEAVSIPAATVSMLFDMVDHLRQFIETITGQDADGDNDGDVSATDGDDMVQKALAAKNRVKMLEVKDDDGSTAADLFENLTDVKDDIPNYDELSQLADEFDVAVKDGQNDVADEVARKISDALVDAANDATEEETTNVLADVAEQFGDMVQDLQPVDESVVAGDTPPDAKDGKVTLDLKSFGELEGMLRS